MTEPTNPLFEDEKDFLERKKLEYERALRGDVEEIKENTVQAGKVALVGAGIVGGIWLLRKAFGGGTSKKKKTKPKKNRPQLEDYAGFDGFDDHDQEASDLATDFQTPDYAYDRANDFADDGFYSENQPGSDDADDNGLSDYPNFPQHSFPHHGDSNTDGYHSGGGYGREEDPAHSYASTHSYQARPYDDSRRLPHSDSFAENDKDSLHPVADAQPTAAAQPKRRVIGSALLAFAQSETGRVIMAQAAAVALTLVTKATQDIMPKHAEETGKNADLAPSSVSVGLSPAAWPATSAAQDAAAAAYHDDELPHREPLA